MQLILNNFLTLKPYIYLWGLFFYHIFVPTKKNMKEYNKQKQTKRIAVVTLTLWLLSLTFLLTQL